MTYTEDEVRQKLREIAVPQKAWAEKVGINQGVLSDIINGRRDLSDGGTATKVLDALGMERIVSYELKRRSRK